MLQNNHRQIGLIFDSADPRGRVLGGHQVHRAAAGARGDVRLRRRLLARR